MTSGSLSNCHRDEFSDNANEIVGNRCLDNTKKTANILSLK